MLLEGLVPLLVFLVGGEAPVDEDDVVFNVIRDAGLLSHFFNEIFDPEMEVFSGRCGAQLVEMPDEMDANRIVHLH